MVEFNLFPLVKVYTCVKYNPSDSTGIWGTSVVYHYNLHYIMSGIIETDDIYELNINAILIALRQISKPHNVIIYTTNNFCNQTFNTHLDAQSRSNWTDINGESIKHRDILEEILLLTQTHNKILYIPMSDYAYNRKYQEVEELVYKGSIDESSIPNRPLKYSHF